MLGLHFPIRNFKHVCVYLMEQVVDQVEKSCSLALSVRWHKMNRLVCSQMTTQNETTNNRPVSSSPSLSLDPYTLRAFLPPQSPSVAASAYGTSSQLRDVACSILYISLCLQNNHPTALHTPASKCQSSVAWEEIICHFYPWILAGACQHPCAAFPTSRPLLLLLFLHLWISMLVPNLQ